MAARLNKAHQDDVRLKIQTSQLINRLQDYALGKKGLDLEPARIKAIEILLRKTLPDMTDNMIKGDPSAPILHVIERRIVSRNAGD